VILVCSSQRKPHGTRKLHSNGPVRKKEKAKVNVSADGSKTGGRGLFVPYGAMAKTVIGTEKRAATHGFYQDLSSAAGL